MRKKRETKEQRSAFSKSYWDRNREWIVALKETTPCSDCGQTFPHYVMQFDHRPGVIKLFGIAKMGTRGRKKIEAEIAKCDLVCANCHAIRTYNRILQRPGAS